MTDRPILRMVDAVMVAVPDLDQGLAFYQGRLGHDLLWRNDGLGQAGLRLPDAETELVLCVASLPGPTWLVESVPEAVVAFQQTGGRTLSEPEDVPVGRLAVVADPFGNSLVLLDLSKGRYTTDDRGHVTGTQSDVGDTAR
jgi:catechol 2,3-dioxygenase-like lactoylglutathione lyase family enzyme